MFEDISDVEGSNLIGVSESALVFSDVDGDGDEDVFIAGKTGPDASNSTAYLALNDGNGFFTIAEETPFREAQFCAIAVADIDGDGDDDVLIAGSDLSFGSAEYHTELYRNEGGSFTRVEGTPFPGVVGGDADFADIDGDGDQDLMIVGEGPSFQSVVNLYRNNDGDFSLIEATSFLNLGFGATVDFADVDGDGDPDLLITGNSTANLYINDGGVFALASNAPFLPAVLGAVEFADVDGDDDLDVFIAGGTTNLYINEVGTFEEDLNNSFAPISIGSVAFSDVDGDDDQDLLISGLQGGTPFTELYSNQDGVFSILANTPFEDLGRGAVGFSDIDGDGDEDLLITGSDGTEPLGQIRLYRNVTNPDPLSTIDSRTDEIVISPNPCMDAVNIDLSEVDDMAIHIRIMNVNGQMVFQESSVKRSGQSKVDLSALDLGIYFVVVSTESKKIYCSKLMKL